LREFKRIFARSLLFLNAPQHTRLRQVVNAGFKPALIEKSAPRIQAIVDQLLDKIEPAGEIDFIWEFARPLPARVIADQLGIDAADRADVLAWSDDIAAFIGSPLPSIELARRAQAGVVALTDYFRTILPQRRRHLGDDLVSLLIRAEHAGKIITSKELLAQCATLLFAGIETTRNLLGNGLFALLKHSEQWQRLKQSPALVPSAVRELLRFDSPVQYTSGPSMTITLYHSVSARSFRPLWMLEELRLPYDLKMLPFPPRVTGGNLSRDKPTRHHSRVLRWREADD
jgi:cytochrome P450